MQITQSLTGTHFGFGFVLHDLDESPLIEAATAAAAANTEAVAREKAERKLAGKLLQAALKESPKAHAQAAIHIARVQSHVALAVTPGSPAHAMQVGNDLFTLQLAFNLSFISLGVSSHSSAYFVVSVLYFRRFKY